MQSRQTNPMFDNQSSVFSYQIEQYPDLCFQFKSTEYTCSVTYDFIVSGKLNNDLFHLVIFLNSLVPSIHATLMECRAPRILPQPLAKCHSKADRQSLVKSGMNNSFLDSGCTISCESRR